MQEVNPVLATEGRPLESSRTPRPRADAAGKPGGGSTTGPLADPRALQILSTEHWSLLASRSLAYNEAFSRASMFLSFLSATLIVIGFLIASLGLVPTVGFLASVLLGADLFIGVVTVGRLIEASGEELQCVRGMNRIRHAYHEMVPGMEPYFVSGSHDDMLGVLATYGDPHSTATAFGKMVHGVGTTVGMIATIDSMLFGALLAAVSLALGQSLEIGVTLAVVAFVVAFAAGASIGQRSAIAQQERAESRFPTPASAAERPAA